MVEGFVVGYGCVNERKEEGVGMMGWSLGG